jgi:hypothetical protein
MHVPSTMSMSKLKDTEWISKVFPVNIISLLLLKVSKSAQPMQNLLLIPFLLYVLFLFQVQVRGTSFSALTCSAALSQPGMPFVLTLSPYNAGTVMG